MYNCSTEITSFHDQYVRLTNENKKDLASYREANKKRVENGLKKNKKSLPIRHINQGSYAMHTINQHPNNDYDIDVGLVFKKEDLKGSQGGYLSALDARKMVCEAVQDKRFNNPPEVRKNCVRIYYNEGHHVDMPVYREIEDVLLPNTIELASNDWIKSDPKAVTEWFNNTVINKSPDETNGRQMRRIVRLLKAWAKSRDSWNMPSGFVISKLVDECYVSVKDRDDKSFYQTMEAFNKRLELDEDVKHPILSGISISKGKEAAIEEMKTRIEKALENLSVLFDNECTNQTALKAWKKIFDHSYFDEQLNKSAIGIITVADSTPNAPIVKKGGDRFA